ncbi:MAG: hypothetical protein CVV47_12460 [Spirochaetae bacterium HGW-Spirochaetae-3]|jgi:hypothetical protein|nr:MAG: hypothetical protein CVV47_12460 [Spirochaetae bacterium HGW-Spirochaetae-3]PKL57995.1 MAG: hypothetical protein CVV34_04635 [Methanomicrobiales archaeon HGW-Methanomicrobiales-5]
MRIWSIHPKYLDSKGLVSAWREGLLARKVLEGKTKGYKSHPQLARFKNHRDPIAAINIYLNDVYNESLDRGYNFNKTKIYNYERTGPAVIDVTAQQLRYEFELLKLKLRTRDVERYRALLGTKEIEANMLFRVIDGEIEGWEKVKGEVLERL